MSVYIDHNDDKPKLRGLSPRANKPTERPSVVGEVIANFCGYRLNYVASVRERIILTEEPPLVGEVSANFRG
jgi:hypothetical protein